MNNLFTAENNILLYVLSTLSGIIILLAAAGLNGIIVRKIMPGLTSPAVLGAVFLIKLLLLGVALYAFLKAGLNAPFLALGITLGLALFTLKIVILNRMETMNNGNC